MIHYLRDLWHDIGDAWGRFMFYRQMRRTNYPKGQE